MVSNIDQRDHKGRGTVVGGTIVGGYDGWRDQSGLVTVVGEIVLSK